MVVSQLLPDELTYDIICLYCFYFSLMSFYEMGTRWIPQMRVEMTQDQLQISQNASRTQYLSGFHVVISCLLRRFIFATCSLWDIGAVLHVWTYLKLWVHEWTNWTAFCVECLSFWFCKKRAGRIFAINHTIWWLLFILRSSRTWAFFSWFKSHLSCFQNVFISIFSIRNSSISEAVNLLCDKSPVRT